MMATLLQKRGPDFLELLEDTPEFLEFLLAPIRVQMGFTAFALIAGGTIILGMWAWTESFLPPAIVLALFGGVFIAAAPGPAALIGVAIVMIALAIAFYSVYTS